MRTLLNRRVDACEQRVFWDGCNDAGKAVPSGVYLYCLVNADGVQQKRMTLVR